MLVSVVGITAKKIRDLSGLAEGFDVAHNDGRIGSNREALSNGAVDDAQSQRVACVDRLRLDVVAVGGSETSSKYESIV